MTNLLAQWVPMLLLLCFGVYAIREIRRAYADAMNHVQARSLAEYVETVAPGPTPVVEEDDGEDEMPNANVDEEAEEMFTQASEASRDITG